MSLEFYYHWSSTVAYKEIFKNYLKYWGSIVSGVFLSLEFFCLWSSAVAIPIFRRPQASTNHLSLAGVVIQHRPMDGCIGQIQNDIGHWPVSLGRYGSPVSPHSVQKHFRQNSSYL